MTRHTLGATLDQVHTMRPAISYYGSKARLSKHMPPPIYDHIIEPFAGDAAYALRWRDRSVTLIDLDEVLCAMWSYLIGAPAQELLALPLIAAGETTEDHTWPCPEARDLVGYWLSPGSSYPCRQPSSWAGYGKSSTWCEATRTHVAQLAETIRHWRVTCGDYTTAPDVSATWFVDPPYQGRPGLIAFGYHSSNAKAPFGRLLSGMRWIAESDTDYLVEKWQIGMQRCGDPGVAILRDYPHFRAEWSLDQELARADAIEHFREYINEVVSDLERDLETRELREAFVKDPTEATLEALVARLEEAGHHKLSSNIYFFDELDQDPEQIAQALMRHIHEDEYYEVGRYVPDAVIQGIAYARKIQAAWAWVKDDHHGYELGHTFDDVHPVSATPELASLVDLAKQLAAAWPELTPDAQLEVLDKLQPVMVRHERKYELLSKNWYQIAQEIQGLMHDDFSRMMRAKAQHYDDVATAQAKKIDALEATIQQLRAQLREKGTQ